MTGVQTCALPILNLAVSANTADTVMYRDNLGSANLNVLNANTTIVTHTGSGDTALSVVSAVAAQSDGSYASILTTGEIGRASCRERV